MERFRTFLKQPALTYGTLLVIALAGASAVVEEIMKDEN